METFAWKRPVPKEWASDLMRLCPGENVSTLHLSWLAGTPDESVQRWVVYEVAPAKMVGDILDEEKHHGIDVSLTRGLWDALHGPDPRTLGKWVPDKTLKSGRRWRSKSLVSRNQWDLHKETGGLPLLCWIIEGSKGGHSWQFGPFEQGFLIATGVDPEAVQELQDAWPNPGSMAYADYDARVFHALAERDLLAKWRRSLSWEDRTQRSQAGLILTGESAARREDMLMRVNRWMENQVSDAVSDIPRSLLPQWSDFAPGDVPDDHSLITE